MKKIRGGKQKVLNYFDHFIELDNFQDTVRWIRKKFKIPKDGFKLPKKLFKNGSVNVPDRLKKTDFTSYIWGITEDFPIDEERIETFLKIYILYNIKYEDILHNDKTYVEITGGVTAGDIFDTYIKYPDGSTNKKKVDKDYLQLCKVEDLKKDFEMHIPLFTSEHIVGMLKHRYEKYPVVIKLHPSTTKNDFLCYIEKNWKSSVEPLLNRHKDKKSKLGKLKTRDPLKKEMYRFIYKNQNLPYKEIVSLAGSKFPGKVSASLDEGSVGKIISLERKRRKEV